VQHATIPDLAGAGAGVGSSSDAINGGRSGKGSGRGATWSEDVSVATHDCVEEVRDLQDFNFDVASRAMLASIEEEDA
jgi:hypothetical protein